MYCKNITPTRGFFKLCTTYSDSLTQSINALWLFVSFPARRSAVQAEAKLANVTRAFIVIRTKKVLFIIIMRWVQVTIVLILKGYTFFKPLDLNRFNRKKKTLINGNILIRISLIMLHLLYFISISKPKKVLYLTLSLSLSLSSTVVPTLWIDCRQKKEKK